MGPTVRYTADGYRYDETADDWKRLCQALPCSLALQWPGYATCIVETIIGGQPVVIQLWKGWCPRFLGLDAFPGGIGAEVGIYRRIPGRARPSSQLFQGNPAALLILGLLGHTADEDLWWPYPELGTQLEFTLTNPLTEQTFFRAGPESSYWLAKWMEPRSYSDYASGSGAPPSILGSPFYPPNDAVPSSPSDFTMDFSVNGRRFATWGRGSPRVTPVGLGLLLLE